MKNDDDNSNQHQLMWYKKCVDNNAEECELVAANIHTHKQTPG